MSDIKVSVLTPIYKHDAKYTRKCLESLQAQTLKECEFILIDNGATPEAKALIEEFLPKDDRFTVIHFAENQGYGKAMNAGIDAAKGEYIGFLESDDFAEPQMYEELYSKTFGHTIDIVKSLYTEYWEKEPEKNKIVNKFQPNQLNRILNKMDIENCFQYIQGHVCHWSAIYKSDFIKNKIYFPFVKIADLGFSFMTYVKANSIYIINKSFVNYRMDNNNSSINALDKQAFNVADAWIDIFKVFQNYDKAFLLKVARQTFVSMCFNYNQRVKQHKIRFLKFISPTLKSYLKMGLISGSPYFSKKEIKKYKMMTNHPFLYRLSEILCKKKNGKKKILFGLFTISKKDNKKVFRFCGLSVIKKEKINDLKKTSYFHGIIKIKNKSLNFEKTKEIYFLGIKIFKKRRFDNISFFNDKIKYLSLQIQSLKSEIKAVQIHIWLKKFFSCHKEQAVVLIACGPSVQYYKKIPNAIHIGINRAFLNQSVPLNYLIIQDDLKDNQKAADEYMKTSCIKLYGKIPEERLRDISFLDIKGVPVDSIIRSKAYEYILSRYYENSVIPLDISVSPFADLGGTIFTALQFALWTRPSKIYLVGCDCTNEGHFYGGKVENFSNQISGWKKMRAFIRSFFETIEIISVNPIGLKGFFHDVYTEDYLTEHPEIDRSSVEILKEGKENLE
ncbi:MAG: glycosyltransferase family 2 protein [Alphaproteobacteria bacterium]|nr:glycosyltransferase family 2 protein [Alphaproteobacteria bacterium]